jgi:hypothetical protein
MKHHPNISVAVLAAGGLAVLAVGVSTQNFVAMAASIGLAVVNATVLRPWLQHHNPLWRPFRKPLAPGTSAA